MLARISTEGDRSTPGVDVVQEKRAVREEAKAVEIKVALPAFEEYAETYIREHWSSWSKKHRNQWPSALKRYAYSDNGGAGKTETGVQLLVSVAAGVGDWLGCVVETGPALFLSCEEPEANIRDRIERICKHLEATWLATADRLGKRAKTVLLLQIRRLDLRAPADPRRHRFDSCSVRR